jgi:hypothetical protein
MQPTKNRAEDFLFTPPLLRIELCDTGPCNPKTFTAGNDDPYPPRGTIAPGISMCDVKVGDF